MFTGIIESLGTLEEIVEESKNRHFRIQSPISDELKVDQSISHDGVCLTVTEVTNGNHWVTAISETLSKSSLNDWKTGDFINLERCLKVGGRLDGHMVQGHVDEVSILRSIAEEGGSWKFTFEILGEENLIVEKGSVTVNGTSLTCFDVSQNQFSVAIIPYTFENTNFKKLKVGDGVNIEFDILGKYIKKLFVDGKIPFPK